MDRDYTLNRTTGEIKTGDGVQGAVPVAYVGDPGGNVVARVYRFGGGRRGNVLARTITTLVTPVDGIDEGQVTNLEPANSGRDEETVDEAKKRAPSPRRSRAGAVRAADVESLATEPTILGPFYVPASPHREFGASMVEYDDEPASWSLQRIHSNLLALLPLEQEY